MAAVVLPAPRYACPGGAAGPLFLLIFLWLVQVCQRIPSPSEKIVRQKKKLKGGMCLGC